MIARVFTAAHCPVHAGRDEALCQRRAQQQMIDTQTGVAAKRIPEYFQKV